MFLTLDKREFQQTMMVYHYYVLVNRDVFLKGIHPPKTGGKPGTGTVKIDEDEQKPEKDRWDWKKEDKIWSHYIGFIKNRSLIYFYAQQWPSFTAKAKFIGLKLAEEVANIELEDDDTKISIVTTFALHLDKKQFQHFMMLYHFNNLDEMEFLTERVDENDNEGQWMNEDRPWYNYMMLYDNRGLTNYLSQRWVNYQPIIKSLGYRMAKIITNSRIENNLRIRISY